MNMARNFGMTILRITGLLNMKSLRDLLLLHVPNGHWVGILKLMVLNNMINNFMLHGLPLDTPPDSPPMPMVVATPATTLNEFMLQHQC